MKKLLLVSLLAFAAGLAQAQLTQIPGTDTNPVFDSTKSKGFATKSTPLDDLGSSREFNKAETAYQIGTLTANCTVTFIGWDDAGYASRMTIRVLQNATGGWNFVWPASVNPGGSPPPINPAPNAVTRFDLETTDGGTTIYATSDYYPVPVEFCIVMSDETTAITTGTAKKTWRAPYAFTVTAVRASVNTVSSSGIPTVDINEGGTTILSTKLTIDASEKTSTTAAVPAVISDPAIADDAEMTMDIDVAGTGAKGLKVWILGYR